MAGFLDVNPQNRFLTQIYKNLSRIGKFGMQYEDMVTDFDNQVRRLLEYCGLPWEENCARFYETDRPVRTASSEQVRQPIYTKAVHFWRNYENKLDEMIEGLEPVLMDLPEDQRPLLLQAKNNLKISS